KVNPNQGINADTPDEAAVRKRITESCEQSLHRLQTDYIDIYQLHAIPYPWAMPIAMETLAHLREVGKIRWYGISTNNREAIDQLRAYGPLHVLQIGFNLLERAADALLHWARAEQIGTLIRVPLAKGMLTGEYSGCSCGFGGMSGRNRLASGVVLPYRSPYLRVTNLMLWGHILSVAPETSSLEGGARFHLDTSPPRPDPLVTRCDRATPRGVRGR